MPDDLPAGPPPDEAPSSRLTNPGAGERLQQDDDFCHWLLQVSDQAAREFRKLFGTDRRLAPHLVRPRTDPERWKANVAWMIEAAMLRKLSLPLPADIHDSPWVLVMAMHTAEVLKSLLGDDGAIHPDFQPPDSRDDHAKWAEALEGAVSTALYLALRDSLVIQPAVTETRHSAAVCFHVHYPDPSGDSRGDS